jgi:tetratricopeptide (TPR) repeat protein
LRVEIVQTLYELLGALPEDDADQLRAAFLEAVKANHPDNNPGDPAAPQRFRRIIRARSILSDEQQRAFYDLLLDGALQERAQNSTSGTSSETRSLFPGIIACMVIASVSIGAFLLFERVLSTSIAQVSEISARVSALTPAMPRRPSDVVSLDGEHNGHADTSALNEPDEVIKEMTVPVAVETAAVAAATSPVLTTPEAGVKDASYYLQRGILAYRNGDLPLALIDFDLAIGLDPNLSDAYIDRAIVFRRIGEMRRALADIAEAKRIDEAKLR